MFIWLELFYLIMMYFIKLALFIVFAIYFRYYISCVLAVYFTVITCMCRQAYYYIHWAKNKISSFIKCIRNVLIRVTILT